MFGLGGSVHEKRKEEKRGSSPLLAYTVFVERVINIYQQSGNSRISRITNPAAHGVISS